MWQMNWYKNYWACYKANYKVKINELYAVKKTKSIQKLQSRHKLNK